MLLSSKSPQPTDPAAKDPPLGSGSEALFGKTKAPSAMRLQILLEAKRLFRDRGYAAVSINDIIDGVGVTKPTLYHYFKDKEALYTEVLITAMAYGARYIQEALLPQQTLKETLTAIAAGYFEHLPTCMATLLRDAAKQLSPENYAKTQVAHKQYLLQPFEALFLAGLERGEIAPKDVFTQGAFTQGPMTDGPLTQRAETLALLFLTYLDTFTALHRHHHGQHSSQHDDLHGVDAKTTAQQLITLLWEGLGS